MPSRQCHLALLASMSLGIASGCSVAPDPDAQPRFDATIRSLSAVDNDSETNPLSASYRPPSDDHTEIVEVPETGVNLGWGWDHHDAEPVRSVCVEFVEASEPAQTRYMTMQEVADSFELMQSMGMSAQASVKTIGFEAKGKAAFAKDANISGYSSNFVMNATVENGVRYTAPVESGSVQLTPWALRLAANDLDEFKHQCGDSYVSAVYAGAKLTALITIETKSKREKQEMSATMSGSGWGAEFEASMSQTENSKTENKDMSVSIFQTGGRGDAIPKDKDDLLAKLNILPAIAFDAPKDFHMAVTPYDSLANWPAQSLDSGEEEFRQLASYWGAYNTLYDEIQHILENPNEFASPILSTAQCTFASDRPLEPEQIERLEGVQDAVLESLHRIEQFARFCTTEEAGCTFPEHLFRSPYAFRTQLPLQIHLANAEMADAAPDSLPQGVEASMKKTRESLGTIYQLCGEGKPLAQAQGYCRLIRQMLDSLAPAASAFSYDIDLLARNTIIDLTKRRCQADKSDPLCLSNGEIDAWRGRMTFEQKTFETLEQRDAVVAGLEEMQFGDIAETCSTTRARPEAPFSAEPGYPAIWYHASIEPCLSGQADQCPGVPLPSENTASTGAAL